MIDYETLRSNEEYWSNNGALVSGIQEYAENNDYRVFIAVLTKGNENKFTNTVFFRHMNGIIIDPIMEKENEIEYLFQLKTLNYPIVLLENVTGINANVVTIDLIDSIKIAVKYLIDNGHTRIIYFSGPPDSYRAIERIEGFIQAFSESSQAFRNEMLVPIGIGFHDGYYQTIKYFEKLKREDFPTAIVCFNDNQALAVITALAELKIKVPDDISIIGNDDIFCGNNNPIPLTTIKTPMRKVGSTAAKVLIDNIESASELKEVHIKIGCEFLLGRSSKILI